MKFAASTRLKRAGATVAIGAALLSMTACGPVAMGQQPTTIHYAASDGVSADLGDIKLRNIMVIASSAESDGRLLGTILNSSDSEATVTFNFPDGTQEVTIASGSEIRFETEQNTTILSPAGANPGEMLRDTQISANGNSVSVNIPVLDGTLEEYATYLPSATETSNSTPTYSETPEFEPLETPTAAATIIGY